MNLSPTVSPCKPWRITGMTGFHLAFWCSSGGGLLPELVLGAWLLALESSLPCPWVYMLGPVASDLPRHTLLWPWAKSLEGVGSTTSTRTVDLPGWLWFTSLLRPIIVSPCYLQLQFCALKFLSVHLLIWTSPSVPKLDDLKIISHTPSPVPVKYSSYTPILCHFILLQSPWNLISRSLSFPAWTFQ